VEDSVKVLNERLAPSLIKTYKNHSLFRTALVEFCIKFNRYSWLVSPVNLLDMIVLDSAILEGLFLQVDLDLILKYLEIDSVCKLLELRQVALVKK
jgi:hypothetical protein